MTDFTVVLPEQMTALRQARDGLKDLAEENEFCYGDALDAMSQAYDAIDALFVPKKPKETYRIVVCVDVDAADLTDAYRAVYACMTSLATVSVIEWESSDEWYAEDGQRIEQDAIDLARVTVLQEIDE